MSWTIPYFLLILTSSISQEVQEFSEQAGKYVDAEALTFLNELYDQASGNPAKCKKCVSSPITIQLSNDTLIVFISFSVPIESWKDISVPLEKMGGCFALKGLPGNSFELFSEKVLELKLAGVNAPILIDPESFEKYNIESVPSVVVSDGEKYDKVSGNIHLETILKTFSEKGSTKELAKKILSKHELLMR